MSKILERADDSFAIGLQSWVDDAPAGERDSRITAMERMKDAESDRLTYLNLRGLLLSSLPSQIGDLVNLQTLDLANNQLNTLPPEIGNLTALTFLNLDYNQLTTLPPEIGNLTALTQLDLGNNQLTTLPPEIGNLTALPQLDLSDNQLTTLPPEIGNLTALKRLNLYNNRLTTLPHSLLAARIGRYVNLENNLIPPAEAEILNELARENRVNLRISIHDHIQLTTPQEEDLTAMVINKILATSPTEEAKRELQTFFESPGLENFKRFLAKCPRTEGWKSHETEMTGCLLEIANKMSQSEAVKIKCQTLAETAFGTCGDRVGLAFVQMQLVLNLSDKKVEDMSIQEVYDYAKQESVIKFLSEKAETKIAEIKTTGGALDEIETHLAYLQIGRELGLNLTANGMLYQGCSNVKDVDLESAKEEFRELDREHQIAKHIYEDGMLRTNTFVKEIIEKVAAREEFDSSPIKGENDKAYSDRMKGLTLEIAETTISEIQKAIQGELTNSSADLVEDAASQQAPDTTVTPLAANRTNAPDTGCSNVM